MVYINAHSQRAGHNSKAILGFIDDVASYHSALNYTTSQSLDLRFIDFKTCTLNYNCGARQPIQNSNTATIQDFDLSSSWLVPRRDRTIVSLLSRIVSYGVKLAGTTSSLHSYIKSKLSIVTELLISQARWTRSSDCKLLYAGSLRSPAEAHLNTPAQPAGLCFALTKRELSFVLLNLCWLKVYFI